MRPHLQIVDVRACAPVDAITGEGLAELGLPAARAGGEELALMQLDLATKQQRLPFADWYENELSA